MMLQEHGGQHSLIQHHSPGIFIFYKILQLYFPLIFGGIWRLLLLLLPHCRVPLRRGIRTRPAMF